MNQDDFILHNAYELSDSVSDDTMLERSEASFHTMSTIQSNEVPGYFRSVLGFVYDSDENVPLYFPFNMTSDRIDALIHFILRYARGGMDVPPAADQLLREGGIDRGKANVLDLITNGGVWVHEMADTYPNAQFVSLDTKPWIAHKPHPRITLEVYDLYSGIIEHDSSFDLVHLRIGIFVTKDLNFLLREIHRILKPNGILSVDLFPLVAYEGSGRESRIHSSTPFAEFLRHAREAWITQEVDIAVWDDLESRLRPAHPHWGNQQPTDSERESSLTSPIRGFQDISLQLEEAPIGSWPVGEKNKVLGALLKTLASCTLRTFASLIQTSGMEESEVRALTEKVDLADCDKYKLHRKFQYWCSRKI